MGRFYQIEITAGASTASPAQAGGLKTVGSTASTLTYTSAPNGIFNPGALLVEFDFFSFVNAASGNDGATITIHGVGLPNITQAQKFSGRFVKVSAGMTGGLELEDPTQKGLILNGIISQSWANWIGTEMNLNLLVFPSDNTFTKPGNFTLNWLAGTPLQDALNVTLATAYPKPGPTPIFNLSKTYILGRTVQHTCKTLGELAAFVKSTTAAPGFSGVDISTPVNNTIVISDNDLAGEGQRLTKAIKYTDLIGQPTWVRSTSMMVTTVMRGDLQIGSIVTMPQGPGGPGQVTLAGVGISTTSVQPSNVNYATAFQGQFLITAIRHVGNSRDTSPTAWVSIFECLPLPATTNAGLLSGLPGSTA